MMLKNKLNQFLLGMSVAFFSISSDASYIEPLEIQNPIYFGVTGGYGSTTWGSLVPKDINDALSTSVPIRVSEGGSVWGLFAGYEIMPAFALEISYMKYPTAHLYFDDMSLFAIMNDCMELVTQTSRVALSGRFQLTIPHTPFRAYSSFGAAEVHRNDSLVNRWRLSPIFGAGVYYDITSHLRTEFGTEYVAGYGQSELDPAEHYIPFLYSAFLRIAVRV